MLQKISEKIKNIGYTTVFNVYKKKYLSSKLAY